MCLRVIGLKEWEIKIEAACGTLYYFCSIYYVFSAKYADL